MQLTLVVGGLAALLTGLLLGRKWQLDQRRVAVAVSVFALLSGVAVGILHGFRPLGGAVEAGLVWLLTMTASLALLVYRFYRDPDRTPPNQTDVVVSPSDGVVLYVRNSREGVLPLATKQGRDYQLTELTKTSLKSQDAVVVGIGLSYLDVHVNRSPIGGRVTLHRHFPGQFGSLRNPEAAFRNERATTLIERDGLEVAVVQIASRLVRQIVSFVKPSQDVGLGQRIGVIRFGSQVDLVLPARPDVKILAAEGQRVWAGESVLAMIEKAASAPATPPPHASQ